MIIYQATKQQFVGDALQRDIEEVVGLAYQARTGSRPPPGEIRAWRESLLHMARVLHHDDIADDCGVAIEYRIPQTVKRVDFIVTGTSPEAVPTAVIIELKQWSSARFCDKDGIIVARRGGPAGETEGPHPSYQAWSYAALLGSFNEAVHGGGVALQPCAYLHNYGPSDGVIDHPGYAPHIERAPLFLKGEAERSRLRAFIRRHVRQGDQGALLYRIDHGRIRPSKSLADSVLGLLQGKPEFVLVDDQKLVFETAVQKVGLAGRPGARKQVLLVRGGPGTGKSVVAVNLLARLTGLGLNVRYVSKNAAPRAVYENRLAGSFRRSVIGNLFAGSGAFTAAEPDSFDALVVDEAHRLNERSGLYGNLGENQIKELLTAARCAVFFVDDDQRVTLKDIGSAEALLHWAQRLGAEVTELALDSQFRCNGSDGYLAWLDHTLDIRRTANEVLDPADFDFRVVDSPVELHALIEERNRVANRARVVAGYCWDWKSKRDPAAWDIDLPAFGYRRRWNLTRDGSLWIEAPTSVHEVGCVHTAQGLEVDTIGVIIGPDLAVQQGRLQTRPAARARTDQSLRGLGALRRQHREAADALADRLIRNTYRTLMTRGLKACYVWCTDPAVAAFLRERQAAPAPLRVPAAAATPRPALPLASVLPFRRVSRAERAAGQAAVPLVDLRFAAGAFSAVQTGPGEELGEAAWDEWVELPEPLVARPGCFVAQVVGESMNRRIPNGAWCLFRLNPQGSRQGRVVVAEHRSISDPDTGGRYTVKVYASSKVTDDSGSWAHTRIELRPDSSDERFLPIVIEEAEEGEFRIVAELVAVIA